jgi:hypothetical protein
MSIRARAITAPNARQGAISLTMAIAFVASFFASVMGPATAFAQSVDTTLAETVPAESVLYVDVDLDQSSEQWTQFYALLDRAGLSDLLQDEADMAPEDVGNIAEMYEYTGSVAIVLTSPDGLTSEAFNEVTDDAMTVTDDPMAVADDAPEGMVAVFQPDDPAALHASFITNIESNVEDYGGQHETTEYNGVTIDFWTSDTPDASSMATAIVEDTVAVAATPAELEVVIDTINGEVESLTTNENFQAVAGAFTTDSLSFGYLDATSIADAASDDPNFAGAMAGYDPAQVGYLGWNAYVDDLGFRLDTVSVSNGAVSPTLLDPTLASSIPGDVLLFLNGTDLASTGLADVLGVFLQQALAEGDSMDATPVATPSVDEVYDELEAQIGFNIKEDLIDYLNGEWALAANAEQLFSEEPQFDVVFVSGVSNPEEVQDTTERITFLVSAGMGEDGGTIDERQVEGGTLTTLTIPDGIAPGVPVLLEWGVIDGELLVGVNDGIDNYLEGSATPLADDPIYQQTFEALPSTDLVSIQFLNLDRTIPMIEEAVVALESSSSVLDNDESCGEYATQEEAQAAYDEDQFDLWMLDLDYDGEACEDFFAPQASPMASPASLTEDLQILSVGSVSYVDGDMYRTSSIVLIGE